MRRVICSERDFGVGDAAGVRIEGGQSADRSHQHAHRVSVVAEALDELLEVLVQEGVDGDVVDPRVQLRLGRQLAVEQQVGDLEEGGVLRELFDRVAAVLQDADVAVDEGDGTAARRRVHESRVVGGQAGVVVVRR